MNGWGLDELFQEFSFAFKQNRGAVLDRKLEYAVFTDQAVFRFRQSKVAFALGAKQNFQKLFVEFHETHPVCEGSFS